MTREEPTYWVSLKTSNVYSYKEYACIEDPKHGYLALPKEGYPYTIMYVETNYGKWMREMGN